MISLIHPSRGRTAKARQTAEDWIHRAGCDVEYILSIDESDPVANYYSVPHGVTGFIKADNHSVVEATNRAAKVASGDILLYLSDDFACFDNWALAVQKEFENEDRPLLIKVDDCLQKFEVPVLTIPIMNRKLYERLSYFWHPEYKSMHVDVDLFYTCRKLNAIKNCKHLKFEHQHC